MMPSNTEESAKANYPGSPTPAVGFVLLSHRPNPIPSTRIACLNLFPFLNAAGFVPRVQWEPETPSEVPDLPEPGMLLGNTPPAVMVFQKIRGPSVVRAVRAARSRGVRTVWCVCDVVDNEMVAETDATIAVTHFLRSLYAPELQTKIHVVHDGIENETLTAPAVALPRKIPRAVLITSSELYTLPGLGAGLPIQWRIEIVGRYAARPMECIKRLYWACSGLPARQRSNLLLAACHPLITRTPWSQSALALAVGRAQIGIIPVDTSETETAHGCGEPVWRVKSENRLTLLMAAGLPVIATPIPAYEEIIDDGRNGFFARTPSDWKRLFARLRDADLRAEIGASARSAVLPRYSMARQAERFVTVLRQALGQTSTPARSEET